MHIIRAYSSKSNAQRARSILGIKMPWACPEVVRFGGQWAVAAYGDEPPAFAEPAPASEPQLPAASEQAEPAPAPASRGPRAKSEQKGSVALVHKICTELAPLALKRSEVIQRCVAQGVAFNTARTQYQRWHAKCKAQQEATAAP